MDTTRKTGTLLFPEHSGRAAVLVRNTMDPRNAAAAALGAYLEKVVFTVAGGNQFQLRDVLREWPESFEGLHYPAAAITAATEPRFAHSLTPTALEDTWNLYCPDSVLWKTSELAVEFQVDFWLNTKPERQAVVARLDDVFNPYESRAGLLLQGPAEYFGLPVRCTFLGGDRIDNSATVFNRDREYRAKILAEIDVVQLRSASELQLLASLAGDSVPVSS